MATVEQNFLRTQLGERRQRLEAAIAGSPQNTALAQLLQEVDSALERMDKGTYGVCEECHDSIEPDRLMADPLLCHCLDHLTAEQRRALEEDLELAARIQRGLLPPQGLRVHGWQIHYHYEPRGPVSGDYCDLIQPGNSAGDLFFLLGDVAGKGVAASMLMTHLHAMFRSLTTVGLPLDQLMSLANRVFCESTMAGQFATLVCGAACRSGEVQICSAGHVPGLLAAQGKVVRIESTGLPLGMFCNSQYAVESLRLAPGESLFLYSDGLSEARNPSSEEFGIERLARFLGEHHGLAPESLMAACLNGVKAFCTGAPKTDDLTIMVLRREG